jgi:hypothetical protein
MIYVSIDVGIKNLAYIIYETNNSTILKWDVLELCKEKSNQVNLIDLGKTMCNSFHDIFTPYEVERVIIENQIGQNAIRMKTLQGMITMYFIQQGINDIYHWNACHKLKDYDIPKKTTYSQRKKLSIQITEKLLKQDYVEYLEHFLSHKKKDDLADCFLQLKDALKKQLVMR